MHPHYKESRQPYGSPFMHTHYQIDWPLVNHIVCALQMNLLALGFTAVLFALAWRLFRSTK